MAFIKKTECSTTPKTTLKLWNIFHWNQKRFDQLDRAPPSNQQSFSRVMEIENGRFKMVELRSDHPVIQISIVYALTKARNDAIIPAKTRFKTTEYY